MNNIKILITAILLTMSSSLFAQNYNLGFENWNGTIDSVYIPDHDSCRLPINAAVNNLDDRLPDWGVSPGVLRTTDAHSGNYAAVVCMWYFGATGMLSFGPGCGYRQICKFHFNNTLFGVSGYYKYDPNIHRPRDTAGNKKTIAYLKTFKADTVTGSLEVLSYDSLEFSPTENYNYFQIAASLADSTIVPDSVSLWFAAQSSVGTTFCSYAQFLYLDDLEFHFSPMASTSVNNFTFKQKIKIFPNPAKNTINLQYNNLHIQSLKLTDLSGRSVKTFPAEKKNLNVLGIAKGLYFLQVRAKEGMLTEKILVQ